MGNTVPPREATGRRREDGTSRPENVLVTEAASPATPRRRVVATAWKQGRDDDDEEEETARARRPRARAGRSLPEGGAAPAASGKVLITVKIVMTRKDAEALVAKLKLKAQSARERKARMAQLQGELRAGSCGGGRDARRLMLPPIKEERFERITPVV